MNDLPGISKTTVDFPRWSTSPALCKMRLAVRSLIIGTMTSRTLDRITFNPRVMGGRACIRGMRIPVSLIVNLVANGMTAAEIIKQYPDLEPEDVRQSLQYAAVLSREEVLPAGQPGA